MKRVTSLLLIAIMIISMVGCSNDGGESKSENSKTETSKVETSKAESSKDTAEEEDTMVLGALYEISKDRVPDRPSMVDAKLKEIANVEAEWYDIQQSAFNDVINTLLASEEYPEVFWGINHPTEVKQMGLDGYLIPMDEHLEEMPAYLGLWSDEDLDTMLAFCSASDGHMYLIPCSNYRSASMSWIYRKSAFEANNWEMPKTVEGLHALLKEIKATDPDAVIMPCRGGWNNAIGGLMIAHGITNKASYVDAWSGEFIPYGYAEDGFRKALEWGNIFYEEGYMDPEFVTGNDNQWTEYYATGQSYLEYQYVERALWAETNMSPVDPDVDWDFTPYNITADESKGYLYAREQTFFEYGYCFTDKIPDEGLERMLKWCDWLCTDEGKIFMEMGIEGETYVKNADGTLQYMDHIYHDTRNPEGIQPWKLGLTMGYITDCEDYIREVGKDSNIVVSKAFASDSNAHYSPAVPTAYTVEEETRLATLDTQINDTAGEYILQFIMGERDVTDDNEWNAYLAALEAAGLAEASKIRTDSYNRVVG